VGMYDDVKAPEMVCQFCDKTISGWQSKNGDCALGMLEMHQVVQFYQRCRCGAFYEFNRNQPATIRDFTLTVTPPPNLDHIVIDLRAFDRLNEMPAMQGPYKNDGDTYVLLFKRSSVNAIPKVLEKNFPEEAKP